WEQFDLGNREGFPVANKTTGVLFRSIRGTTTPTRFFPEFSDILSGVPDQWEVLPTVNRTLNFRVTVRDNQLLGGGVDYDSRVVSVAGAPFQITAPAAGASLECGGASTL